MLDLGLSLGGVIAALATLAVEACDVVTELTLPAEEHGAFGRRTPVEGRIVAAAAVLRIGADAVELVVLLANGGIEAPVIGAPAGALAGTLTGTLARGVDPRP